MRPWTTCSLKVRKKRSATPLVSGSPTKAKLAAMPQNLIWFWKLVGHECAAMVVAECKTACDPGRDSAELGFDRHADSLGRGVAITNLGNVPPHGFGVPVVDDGKQPDLAIQHGRDLRSVGAPHQVWRLGDDAAVVGCVLARQVAVWRQQAILPHQPQHP